MLQQLVDVYGYFRAVCVAERASLKQSMTHKTTSERWCSIFSVEEMMAQAYSAEIYLKYDAVGSCQNPPQKRTCKMTSKAQSEHWGPTFHEQRWFKLHLWCLFCYV